MCKDYETNDKCKDMRVPYSRLRGCHVVGGCAYCRWPVINITNQAKCTVVRSRTASRSSALGSDRPDWPDGLDGLDGPKGSPCESPSAWFVCCHGGIGSAPEGCMREGCINGVVLYSPKAASVVVASMHNFSYFSSGPPRATRCGGESVSRYLGIYDMCGAGRDYLWLS